MSAPGDEIAGDECSVMSPPMMSCPVTVNSTYERLKKKSNLLSGFPRLRSSDKELTFPGLGREKPIIERMSLRTRGFVGIYRISIRLRSLS